MIVIGTNNSVLTGSHVILLQVFKKSDSVASDNLELFSITFIAEIFMSSEMLDGGSENLGVVGLISSKPVLALPPPERISVAYGEEFRLDLGNAIEEDDGGMVDVTLN